MNQDDHYSTSDLSLATTLSLYHPIVEINRSNPRKAVFVFERTPGLQKLIEEYFRNEIKVAPQIYFNQLRVVKARLYDSE